MTPTYLTPEKLSSMVEQMSLHKKPAMLWPGSDRLSKAEKRLLHWDLITDTLDHPYCGTLDIRVTKDGVWLHLMYPLRLHKTRLPFPRELAHRLRDAPSSHALAAEVFDIRCQGWSVQELAAVLGVSRQWVHVILQKDPLWGMVSFEEHPMELSWEVMRSAQRACVKDTVDRAGGPQVVRELIEMYGALPDIVRGERSHGSHDLEQVESFWVRVADLVDTTNVNVYVLSRAMGLSRTTLYNGLGRYGLVRV